MSSELQIQVSKEEGNAVVTVFKLAGEVTSDNYEQLQSQAQAEYDGGMRHLLLDFSGVSFMSSAGLRSIHAIYKMLLKEGETEGEYKSKNIKLLNVPEKIMKLIRVTGFHDYMDIFDDYQKAISSF
jgi:anti-anti-sigma factor